MDIHLDEAKAARRTPATPSNARRLLSETCANSIIRPQEEASEEESKAPLGSSFPMRESTAGSRLTEKTKKL